MYPIAHTLVSLVPWGYEKYDCKTQCYSTTLITTVKQSWNTTACQTNTHAWLDHHLVSEKPFKIPRSHIHTHPLLILTLLKEHYSISREKVSIATPHPSSHSMPSGTRCQERVWQCNFSFTKHTLWHVWLKTSHYNDMHYYMRPRLILRQCIVSQLHRLSLFLSCAQNSHIWGKTSFNI